MMDAVLGDAEVVLFDNVSTLFRTGQENEAESWAPVQNWLLKLRREGRTVVIIHHSNKAKAQRGTSKREDVLDTVLNLRAPSDYEPSEAPALRCISRKRAASAARRRSAPSRQSWRCETALRSGPCVTSKMPG